MILDVGNGRAVCCVVWRRRPRPLFNTVNTLTPPPPLPNTHTHTSCTPPLHSLTHTTPHTKQHAPPPRRSWGVDILKGFSTFSALVLAFTFIFGNSLRNVYEAMLFLFVEHAYDVGDLLEVEGAAWRVKQVGGCSCCC